VTGRVGAGKLPSSTKFQAVGKLSQDVLLCGKIIVQKCKIWGWKSHVGKIWRQSRNFQRQWCPLSEIWRCLWENCSFLPPPTFLANDAASAGFSISFLPFDLNFSRCSDDFFPVPVRPFLYQFHLKRFSFYVRARLNWPPVDPFLSADRLSYRISHRASIFSKPKTSLHSRDSIVIADDENRSRLSSANCSI